MSIDLYINRTKPIRFAELLPQAADVFGELLGLRSKPALTLHERVGFEYPPITGAALKEAAMTNDRDLLVLVAVEGNTDEGVEIINNRRGTFTVSIRPAHTNLQFVVGAAIAIALARVMGEHIENAYPFGGVDVQSPDELFNYFKVPGCWDDYHQAADQLEKKLEL